MNSRMVLIVGVASFLGASPTLSLAQGTAAQGQEFEQNAALNINVTSVTGAPGQTVPMNFSITGPAERPLGFVMIRGIPDQFKLSNGFLSGNTWLVSLSELDVLKLIVPNDFTGRFDIEVVFVVGGSKQKYLRYTFVNIRPEGQPQKPIIVLGEGEQTRTPPVSVITTQPELQPTKPIIVLGESKQTQIPAFVPTLPELQPTEPVIALGEGKQTQTPAFVTALPERKPTEAVVAPGEGEQAQTPAFVPALPERKPTEPVIALSEGNQTQTPPVSVVATQPESQPEERLIILEEGKQTPASVAIQPESQPKERLAVLDEGKQTQPLAAFVVALPERRPQTPSAFVVALPERRPKDGLLSVEAQNASPQAKPVVPPVILPEGEKSALNNVAAPSGGYDVRTAREIYDQLAHNGTLFGSLGLIKPRNRPPLPANNITPIQPNPAPAQQSNERSAVVANAAAPVTAITCDGQAQIQADGRRIVTPYCQDGQLANVAQSYGLLVSADEVRYNRAEKARLCRLIGDDERVRATCASYRDDLQQP